MSNPVTRLPTASVNQKLTCRKALVKRRTSTEKPAPIVKQFDARRHLGAVQGSGQARLAVPSFTPRTVQLQPPRYRGESRSMVIVGPSIDRVEVDAMSSRVTPSVRLRSLAGLRRN